MKDKYDAIIIGAGIGGLVCGCYLAKAGMKVIIIEKGNIPGGCCVSFRRKNIRFDAGAHIIGSCGEKGVLYRILKNLGVEQNFVQFNPTERFFFGEDVIEVPTELDKYISLLIQKFPTEKEGIEIFFKELVKMAKDVRTWNEKCGGLTYQDFLDKHIENLKLKAILSAQAGYLGVAPKIVSAVAMCAMLFSYLDGGAYYPSGGASAFSDNLALKFKSLGGEIQFRCMVKKIIMSDNNVAGIMMSRGRVDEKKYSNTVISNVDCHQTFFDLMNKNNINDAVRVNINESVETPSLFILYLGVKINKGILAEKVGWHYPEYDVNKSFNNCVYITSPSVYDDTAAPDGISALEAFQVFPYGYGTIRDWKACKKEMEMELLNKLCIIIPEVKNSIYFKESATPETIYKYTLNRNGAPYGWALTPGQYDRNCLIAKESNENLLLTGHWANPGGGVLAVAISGYNVAREILTRRKC